MPLYNWLLLYNYLIVQEAQLSWQSDKRFLSKLYTLHTINSNHIQIERHVAIAIPSRSWCYVIACRPLVSELYFSSSRQFHSVYSHSDNNESKVIRILAFLCDALLVLCLSCCPYSLVALNCDRRKICCNLSTAAELGSVELIFMNAVASVGHGRGCQWTSAWIALTKFLHYCS